MILRHLVDLRDFCFVFSTKRDGEQEARFWYQYQVMALCISYYFAFVTAVALILNRSDTPLIPIPITYPIQLLVGISLFIPYFVVFKYLFRKAAKYPIDKNMSPEKFIRLRNKTILIVLIGVALVGLVLFAVVQLQVPKKY